MTHVRTLLSHSSKLFAALVAAALIFTWTTQPAIGHHQPANKFAAAGAALADIEAGNTKVILSETMKVPSTHDLALSATLECSILTYLKTTGTGPTAEGPPARDNSSAEGRVDIWVTIDGTPVPVQTGAINEQGHRDDGKVTFCNREYARYVEDTEEDEDGIDEERDFIRTRTANAFNWFALNIGSYDKPDIPAGSSNNVVLIELHAAYERTSSACDATAEGLPANNQEDCSNAFVGKRTLVAEPTNASVHEEVEPYDTPATPSDQEEPEEPCELPPLCVARD